MLKHTMTQLRTAVVVGMLGLASLWTLQASASLIGDMVTGVEHYDGFADNFFDAGSGGTGANAIVGAGIEFSTPAFVYAVQANLGAFDLFITHNPAPSGAGGANGFTVDLGDLDFGGGAIITGVNLVSNDFAGVATLTYSFTGDSIHVDVDPYSQPGTTLAAHFEFITSTVVPEPATLTLLGLGLAGLGFVRRRKQ